MLFYESAKCLHGRPRPLRGSYYASVFVHYKPVDWDLTSLDVQYAGIAPSPPPPTHTLSTPPPLTPTLTHLS